MRSSQLGETVRAIGARAALVVLGTLVGIALTEIGVRVYVASHARDFMAVYGYVESDVPGIAYLPAPRTWAKGRLFTNNLGLVNAADTSPAKPAGTFRILVIGDSASQVVMDLEGRESLHAVLFTGRLEALLRERTGRAVEVLNLSAVGISLAQELVLLNARGWALEPDVVLFAYCYNDPVETDVGHNAWHDSPTFPALLWLLDHLDDQNAARREGDWYAPSGEIYRRLESTFRDLGVLAQQHRVALVGLPLLWDSRARQIHLPTLEKLTAANRIPYLDVWPQFSAAHAERWTSPHVPTDHIHYTVAAHELLAETLATRLARTVVEGRWPPDSRAD